MATPTFIVETRRMTPSGIRPRFLHHKGCTEVRQTSRTVGIMANLDGSLPCPTCTVPGDYEEAEAQVAAFEQADADREAARQQAQADAIAPFQPLLQQIQVLYPDAQLWSQNVQTEAGPWVVAAELYVGDACRVMFHPDGYRWSMYGGTIHTTDDAQRFAALVNLIDRH